MGAVANRPPHHLDSFSTNLIRDAMTSASAVAGGKSASPPFEIHDAEEGERPKGESEDPHERRQPVCGGYTEAERGQRGSDA